MHQNVFFFFNVTNTRQTEPYFSIFFITNEDFLLHFATIRNSYFMLCVPAVLFLSILFLSRFLHRIKTMTLFRFRIFCRDSSWDSLCTSSFLCILHNFFFFFFFEIHIAIYLSQRCLNFVVSFLKRYAWNVFAFELFFYYSIFSPFAAVRIEYCFVTRSTAYMESTALLRIKN